MAKQGTKKGCEAEIAERKIKAFEFRKQGYSYRAIGLELGISRQGAYNDVWDVIGELNEQSKKEGKEYLQLETEKLNDYLKIIKWRIDVGDNAAMTLALKIHERFCKLRGLEVEKVAPVTPDGQDEFTGFTDDESRMERLIQICDSIRERRNTEDSK